MSLDYLNNKNSKFKAFGSMIFCGSATIGVMNAGYNVEKILEISEDIVKQNAYHFVKNFPEMPVILPSEWENDEYLANMKEAKYDFAYFNCPCSSLSSINRNASVDGKNNVHFYRVFNTIQKTEPKAFLIENAPTLIKLGYPIIKDLTHILGDKYRFTIVRDFAGNHNVAMKRMRTLVIGWHRDHFNKIPLLEANIQPQFTTKDCIGDLYNKPLGSIPNHECISGSDFEQYSHLFNDYVDSASTSVMSFIKYWDKIKDEFNDKDREYLERVMGKINSGKGVWDKSPYKPSEDSFCPSMTSLTKIIHPVLDRLFTVREYARLMNYPDDFIIHEGGETPIVQCLAQGVPANFVKYIATEVKEALAGNRDFIEDSEDKILSFQHHTKMKRDIYTQDEVNELTQLDVNKDSIKILK